MFSEAQKQIVLDALEMAKASNKRMQASKPQFKAVFDKIASDLSEVETLIRTSKNKA